MCDGGLFMIGQFYSEKEIFMDELLPILCTMFAKFVFINKICVIYSSFYKHLSLKTTENVKNKFYNLQNAELIIILPR